MRWRCVLLALFALAGCESLRPPVPVVAVKPGDPRVVSEPVAIMVALAADVPDDTSTNFEPIDSLSLAAECLARGDEPAACEHLEAYVHAHPDQPLFRVQLAELQFKTGKPAAARANLERFVGAAAELGQPLRPQRIQAHTTLMEFAALEGDTFKEVFHRGLGLLAIVEQQDADPEHDEAFREQILCKAVRELREAKQLRPENPRVRLYLAEAYECMGNTHAADRERQAARNLNRPGALAAPEQRALAGP